MVEWLELTADPGRVHTEGRMVRAALENARDQVAALLGARNREVVFTSGATEAANAATWGALAAAPPGSAVLVSAVEHSCVREASSRSPQHPVIDLAVDSYGRIDPTAVSQTLARHDVALVHCQVANHEVGTLQPVAQIVADCRAAGVLVHVDAAQAAGHVAIDFASLGADLMSVSGHKFGGPPGSGALLVRRGLRVAPLLVGGDQERARRAGMENAPAMIGLGVAAHEAGANLERERAEAYARTERLRDALASVEQVTLFGDPDAAGRLAHIVCGGVGGVEAEAVLLGLDQAGIAAHSGSACSSEALQPSPVLQAMGVDAERSLRLSVGWSTTEADVDAAVVALPRVVTGLRALAG